MLVLGHKLLFAFGFITCVLVIVYLCPCETWGKTWCVLNYVISLGCGTMLYLSFICCLTFLCKLVLFKCNGIYLMLAWFIKPRGSVDPNDYASCIQKQVSKWCIVLGGARLVFMNFY